MHDQEKSLYFIALIHNLFFSAACLNVFAAHSPAVMAFQRSLSALYIPPHSLPPG